MHPLQQLLSALLLSAWLIQTAHAAGRVVQLITENPSAFVAADPNDPQYLVTLFDEDHQPSELPPASGMLRHMLMTDAAGLRYNCSIPGTPSHLSSSAAAQQASQQTAAGTAATSRTPFDLLDSLMGLCLYRQDGLWTYEVCHKKHVRQFRQAHLPSDGITMLEVSDSAALGGLMHAVEAGDSETAFKELGKLLGGDTADAAKGKEDFSCGEYSGDDVQTEAILEDASSSGYHMKYVSHVFSGGADCLLTGAPRTAEVRYTCARDTKENVVVSVKEFPTCNYVVVVSTPFLCKHLAFLPTAQDLRLISCLAIDEQGEAVIKELRALATAQKPIADGSKQAADGVQTPKVQSTGKKSGASASTPPAAGGKIGATASTPPTTSKHSAAVGSHQQLGATSSRQPPAAGEKSGEREQPGDVKPEQEDGVKRSKKTAAEMERRRQEMGERIKAMGPGAWAVMDEDGHAEYHYSWDYGGDYYDYHSPW